MTEIWYPNSCDCIIEKEKRVLVKSIAKCKLHKNIVGQAHLNVVIAHNHSINVKFGTLNPPNDFPSNMEFEDMRKLALLVNRGDVVDYIDKVNNITKALDDERERIRNLP